MNKINTKSKTVLFSILLLMILINSGLLSASGIGENVNVQTILQVGGNIAPEVLSAVITNQSDSYTPVDINLNPGLDKDVYCNGKVRDFDGSSDIVDVNATLFQSGTSEWASDDNNVHYSNSSCSIDYGGDPYNATYSCSFSVQYYTNPGTWNCSVHVYDTSGATDSNSITGAVNELIAISLPSSLDYGTVNATYVSDEGIINLTNIGNVKIDLNLNGYATNPGDGQAMICSQGSVQNISLMYEKYNITETNPFDLSYAEFAGLYTGLTSAPTFNQFDLNYRQDDLYDDAINATYWRIYVPKGVAGNCTGNIVFAAAKAV